MTTEPLTPEQAREDVAVLRERYAGDLTSTDAVRIVQLCATVEAQAEVIERYKEGWHAMTVFGREWWRGWDDDEDEDREPMPEAHQLVLYGEVVAPKEVDS